MQQWHARGHEVADHTVDNVTPNDPKQILLLRDMISHYSNFSASDIKGFRSPNLETNALSLETLQKNGFTWDSSIGLGASNGFISSGASNLMWPYTLDYGIASTCQVGIRF